MKGFILLFLVSVYKVPFYYIYIYIYIYIYTLLHIYLRFAVGFDIITSELAAFSLALGSHIFRPPEA